VDTFSYSRLTKYLSCPASFYRHYMLGMKEPPTLPLAIGKASHATVEIAAKLYNHGVNSSNTFQIAAEAAAGMSPVKVESEELIKLTYKKVVTDNFNKKNNIETHFVEPLDPDNPFSPSIQGYIDVYRIEDDFTKLIDWKTNFKEYHPLDNHQLGLYAYFLSKKTGLPVQGNLIFLRSGNIISHQYTHKEMESARVWALETATEIQKKIMAVQKSENPNEVFPTKHGEACEFCGWSKYCTDDFLSIPEEIVTHEQAREVAKKIILLESSANQLKAILKPYVDICGSVRIDKKEFRFVDAGYWRWNAKAIKSAYEDIKSSNKNPFEYFTISSYGLKKLAWDDKKITSFGARKSSSHQFKLVKAVDDSA